MRAIIRCRPLQHLIITIGLPNAAMGLRPMSFEYVGFAVLVINKVDFRQAHQHRLAVNQFVFHFDAAADNLLG